MPKDTHENNYHNLIKVIILAVILLTIGQVVLYRNIQSVKTMISVTTMEIKEGKGVKTEAELKEMMEKDAEQKVIDSTKK